MRKGLFELQSSVDCDTIYFAERLIEMIHFPNEFDEELSSPRIDVAVDLELDTSTQVDDKIRCRNCSYLITRGRWAIEQSGVFEHRFRNPAGWSFQVGCYAKAPGTLPLGNATSDHSWFSGYLWRFAMCGKCGTHLGWWYIGPDIFAGLIVTRLC